MVVCAGIALHGLDATFVRSWVLVTLIGASPGRSSPTGRRFIATPARQTSWRGAAAANVTYFLKVDARHRSRMAEVENYVTSTNSSLAREIESLR